MGFLSKQASTSLNSKSSSGGGYLKIVDKSEVRFTILEQHPLEFYEVWATNPDNKDERRTFRWDYQPTAEDVAADLGDWIADEKYDQPGTQNVRFTLACPVYNYATNSVQVYCFSQTTVMREIDAISQMEDFDKDITTVDLVIGYDKSKPPALMYTVRPVPKKKGTEALVAAAWIEAKENGFDINRLITGGNPFKAA
jgi:hypothetical protein